MRFKILILVLLLILPFAVPPTHAQSDPDPVPDCTPENVLDWLMPVRMAYNEYVAELDSDNGWTYNESILAAQSLRRQLEDTTPPDCALPIKYNFIVSYANLTDFLMFNLTGQENLSMEISVKRFEAITAEYDRLINELSTYLDFDLRQAYIEAEETHEG